IGLTTKTAWRAGRLKRRCEQHRTRSVRVDDLNLPTFLGDLPPEFQPDPQLITKTAKRKASRPPTAVAEHRRYTKRLREALTAAAASTASAPVAFPRPPYLD